MLEAFVIQYNERKNVGITCIIVCSCIKEYPFIFYVLGFMS